MEVTEPILRCKSKNLNVEAEVWSQCQAKTFLDYETAMYISFGNPSMLSVYHLLCFVQANSWFHMSLYMFVIWLFFIIRYTYINNIYIYIYTVYLYIYIFILYIYIIIIIILIYPIYNEVFSPRLFHVQKIGRWSTSPLRRSFLESFARFMDPLSRDVTGKP